MFSAVVLFAAAILQSSLLPHLAVLGVKADLVLLLVIAWSIRRGIQAGLLWALLGGMAVDALSAGPFGVSILAYGAAAVLVGSLGPGMRQASVLLPLALTPLASILATLGMALALALLGRPISWPVTVALVVLPVSLLNSLVMLGVYPVVCFADHQLSGLEWPT